MVLGYAGRRAFWRKEKRERKKKKMKRKLPSSVIVHQLRTREPPWSL